MKYLKSGATLTDSIDVTDAMISTTADAADADAAEYAKFSVSEEEIAAADKILIKYR